MTPACPGPSTELPLRPFPPPGRPPCLWRNSRVLGAPHDKRVPVATCAWPRRRGRAGPSASRRVELVGGRFLRHCAAVQSHSRRLGQRPCAPVSPCRCPGSPQPRRVFACARARVRACTCARACTCDCPCFCDGAALSRVGARMGRVLLVRVRAAAAPRRCREIWRRAPPPMPISGAERQLASREAARLSPAPAPGHCGGDGGAAFGKAARDAAWKGPSTMLDRKPKLWDIEGE
jgi:hypothetical protein